MVKSVFGRKLKKSGLKYKRKSAIYIALGAAGIILLISSIPTVLLRHTANENQATAPELNGMSTQTLRKQVGILERKVRRLAEKRKLLYPSGSSILVDSARNQVYLLKGSKVVAEDKCSTGSGLELTETSGRRSWTFDTPRGYFRVLGKVSDPVWFRPDWAFIEEGESIPKSRAGRAVSDVLGKYAIAFGDGFFIHGTLYTRMLGSSVTHGCIRVDDDTLKKLYDSSQSGTPIWIY
jgi:lipoprotein-anchoring transpeptidase ErfK/SrfK